MAINGCCAFWIENFTRRPMCFLHGRWILYFKCTRRTVRKGSRRHSHLDQLPLCI